MIYALYDRHSGMFLKRMGYPAMNGSEILSYTKRNPAVTHCNTLRASAQHKARDKTLPATVRDWYADLDVDVVIVDANYNILSVVAPCAN
jgi:hypothetical protein